MLLQRIVTKKIEMKGSIRSRGELSEKDPRRLRKTIASALPEQTKKIFKTQQSRFEAK